MDSAGRQVLTGFAADCDFDHASERAVRELLQLEVGATMIADVLPKGGGPLEAWNAAVAEHPQVTFGSYPFVSHPDFKTVLTLEGRMISQETTAPRPRESFTKDEMDRHVTQALDYLLTNLPEGSILRVENDDGLL